MKIYTEDEKWDLFASSFKKEEGYKPSKRNTVHQQLFVYFKSGFNWKNMTDCLR